MSEAAEAEVQTNPIEDLIKYSLDQNYNKANDLFGDLMGQKVFDALEAEKIKVAGQIYNGEEPEEQEAEVDDDQLELDLGDEEESEVEAEAETEVEDEVEDEEPVEDIPEEE